MKGKSELDFVKLSKKVTLKISKKAKITTKNVAVDYTGFIFLMGKETKVYFLF